MSALRIPCPRGHGSVCRRQHNSFGHVPPKPRKGCTWDPRCRPQNTHVSQEDATTPVNKGQEGTSTNCSICSTKIKQIPRKTHSGMKGDRQSLQNALLPRCSAAPNQFHCPRCPCRTDAAGRSARVTGSVPRAAQASNRCAPRGLGWAFRTRNKKSGGNEALLVLLLMEQLVLIKKNY